MTIELASDYVRRRMNELGYGEDYFLRIRHIVMRPREKRTLDADNQLLMLADVPVMITIQSEFGVFDLSASNINELQYEHQGKVSIINHSALLTHIRFVQAIPNHKTP